MLERWVIAAFVAIACCACAADVDVWDIDNAERIAKSDPGRAFDILHSFDMSNASDSALIARWALLHTETAFKSGYRGPLDSAVFIAEEYYRHRPVCASDYRRAVDAAEKLRLRPDYHPAEDEHANIKKPLPVLSIVATILAIAAVAAAVAASIFRRKNKRLAEELMITQITESAECLRAARPEINSPHAQINSLLITKIAAIADIAGEYYRSNRRQVADRIRADLRSLRADTILFEDMEAAADTNNSMITMLRREFSDISDADLRLFTFTACSLPLPLSALLLDTSTADVLRRTASLQRRISASTLPHKYFFLTIF